MTIDQAAERLRRFHIDEAALDVVYAHLPRKDQGPAYAGDLKMIAKRDITERPQLLAEIESLRKEKTNLEAFVKLQDNAIDNSDSLRAKADAFDWLVESETLICKGSDEFVILAIDCGLPPFRTIGRGTTQLGAVEDAKRRSEG